MVKKAFVVIREPLFLLIFQSFLRKVLVVQNYIVSLKCQKEINQLKIKDMKATIELTRRTALEDVIIRNDNSEKSRMIQEKQRALENAKENAEYYRSIGQNEFADNEDSRARLLERQIKSLKN